MTPKAEGTFVLEGMLEGPLPQDNDARQRLTEAVAWTGRHLPLHLEMDGPSFNILALGRPMAAAPLGDPPSDRVADLLNAMLDRLPMDGKRELFSTLRSLEYRPGMEIQTLYFVGPDGKVSSCARVLGANTTPPGRWPRHILGPSLLALLALAILLGGWGLSVQNRSWVEGLFSHAKALDASAIDIDPGAFAEFLSVTDRRVQGQTLQLTLTRTDAYPIVEQEFTDMLARRGQSLGSRLAIEALAVGYIRIELFGQDGRFIESQTVRVAGLRESPSAKVAISLPRSAGLRRIALFP